MLSAGQDLFAILFALRIDLIEGAQDTMFKNHSDFFFSCVVVLSIDTGTFVCFYLYYILDFSPILLIVLNIWNMNTIQKSQLDIRCF